MNRIPVIFMFVFVGFWLAAVAVSIKFSNYLADTHKDRRAEFRKGGYYSFGLLDAFRFQRYIWSRRDDEDAGIHKWKMRLRVAIIGGIASGLGVFISALLLALRVPR